MSIQKAYLAVLAAIKKVVTLTIDLMEYATDGAAQSAYVTSGGESIIDRTKNYTVTIGGDASLSAAQYSGYNSSVSSISFAGAGYLSVPDNADWDFGLGDFTVDFFVRWPTTVTAGGLIGRYSPQAGTWGLQWSGNNLYWYYDNGTAYTRAWTPSADTWYHVALTRSGTDLKIFIDGTQQGATISDSVNYNDDTALIVGNYGPSFPQPITAYIDNIRVVKGTALFTLNFALSDANLFYTGSTNFGNVFIPGYALQSYSESSISEGTYSLGLEVTTDALNETVTRTLTGGDILDLTRKNSILFDIQCTGTGASIIQAQITDVGATNSTYDVTISSADTPENKTWDISGISVVNKDAINKLIWKIINADSARKYKIDNVRAE